MNNILSIVIPTFNRSDILEYNIKSILQELIDLNIAVYISDDSSDNKTKEVISRIKKKYQNIYYNKNSPSFGHDLNCLESLKMSETDYVWYLGDSMIIKKGSLDKILHIIEKENPDFISFKEDNRDINVKSQVTNNSNFVFENLAWHLTMSGVTVYRKKALDLENFPLSKFKNFPQLALIFSNFINFESRFVWINENFIVGNTNKKSYWSNNVFNVFFIDFRKSLLNLPQKFEENKIEEVLRSHNIKSKLFGYHSLVKMRISNVYNFDVLKHHYQDFENLSGKNILELYILALFPKRLLSFFYNIAISVMQKRK